MHRSVADVCALNDWINFINRERGSHFDMPDNLSPKNQR